MRKGKAPTTAGTVDGVSVVDQFGKWLDNSAQSATAQLSIFVAPTSGKSGYFDAWGADCSTFVCTSRSPFLNAAQVLICAGFPPDSPFEMRRVGSAGVALRARLGTAAGLAIEEGAHGPTFRKRRIAPQSAVASRYVNLNREQATPAPGSEPNGG